MVNFDCANKTPLLRSGSIKLPVPVSPRIRSCLSPKDGNLITARHMVHGFHQDSYVCPSLDEDPVIPLKSWSSSYRTKIYFILSFLWVPDFHPQIHDDENRFDFGLTWDRYKRVETENTRTSGHVSTLLQIESIN